jgi:hypothetical protein
MDEGGSVADVTVRLGGAVQVSKKHIQVQCGGLRLGQEITVEIKNINTIEGCRQQWKCVKTATDAAQTSRMSLNVRCTEFVCVTDLNFSLNAANC